MGNYYMKQDFTEYLAPDLREQGFELHARGRNDILFYHGRIRLVCQPHLR